MMTIENTTSPQYSANRDRLQAPDGATVAITLAHGHCGASDVAQVLRNRLNAIDDLVPVLQEAHHFLKFVHSEDEPHMQRIAAALMKAVMSDCQATALPKV